MARKYVNPAKSAPIDDQVLAQARVKAEAAAARLREAERGDPVAPGWSDEFEAATTAARATARRVEALEQLRAAQLERNGERATRVRSAQKDLASMATALATSRDAVAAAAAEHLRQLAALASAAEGHNAQLAEARSRVAELGLRVDNPVGDGAEHNEGILGDAGLRAGGVDWIPIPAAGIVAHALRQVYASAGPLHPLSQVGRYSFRPHEVESRADGLRVPSLSDAGATAPEAPPRAIPRGAPVADLLPPREDVPANVNVSGFERAPRRGRAAR